MLGAMTKQVPNRLYGMIEGQVTGAIHYHRRIAEAIIADDAETARGLMVEHMIDGGEILVRHLDAQGIWAGPVTVEGASNAA